MAEDQDREAVQADAPDRGEVLAAWEFMEHEQHKRGWVWYVVAGAVTLALIVYSYFDGNFLLAVIVVLGALIFTITEMRGPDVLAFVITEDGLAVGPAFYPWAEIANFFIVYEPPEVKMLYFNPKSALRPLVGVPLMEIDPNQIREILAQFLPEDLEREGEPMGDFLGRIFRF